MRTDEVRNAKYSSSPVLNHPMTWGLALIQEAPVCRNMSTHVPCRSGQRCLLAIFGAAPKLEIFGQSFGMKGPMQLLSSMSQQTAGEAFWCCGTLWKLGGSVDVLSLAFF